MLEPTFELDQVAQVAAARAEAAWRKLGYAYEAALTQADSDDPRVARNAIEHLQQMDASPAATIVAHRLRELGIRGVPRGPRPRTRQNAAGLAARELEELPLIAEGLRNSQIAKRLVVTEKTVDHHVSAILATSTSKPAGKRPPRPPGSG